MRVLRLIVILILAMVLIACRDDGVDHRPVRADIFAMVVAGHPVVGQDHPLRAWIVALRGCELFDEDSSAAVAHVVDMLWWEDSDPWPHETISWVVLAGVGLLCPEHLGRVEVVDPTSGVNHR